MKTLTLELVKQTADNYQLRLGDKQRSISVDELQRFIDDSQASYKNGLNLSSLGQALFNWLNGAENWLTDCQNSILQIKTSAEFDNIPWELLNNSQNQQYLCAHPHKPFTPQYLVSSEQQDVCVEKRPLRLLFMASSPENVNPILDFEQEEASILNATAKTNLELIVEESGSLDGLTEHISDSPELFDVVHLTGHADIKNGEAVFLLEDDYGQSKLATADDIASVFSRLGRYPRLLFLSGCKTAQMGENSLPSLAVALVQAGVPAVLGWAKPVYDTAASIAAKAIYQLLAEGADLARAVALARQALYQYDVEQQKNNPHYEMQWHLLRFYTDNTPLIALAEKGWRLPQRKIEQEFLDKDGKSEVCLQAAFVGRRRLLQQCIRVLLSWQGDADYAQGVMLLGMGGLGKSSLAQRLCQRLIPRLPTRFIFVGRIDLFNLRQVFSEQLPQHDQAINEILNQKTPLSSRLLQLFNQYDKLHQALWVFDDFEQNFVEDSTTQVKANASEVIQALATVVHQTGSPSRLVITSRYALNLPTPLTLAFIPLSHFEKADLDKKVTALRLQYLKKEKQEVLTAQETQAISLSAGNPRLLEWLYRVLAQSEIETDALLAQLEKTEDEFRIELLLESILLHQTRDARQLCALLALFEIAVPIVLIQSWGTKVEKALSSVIAVGLVEKIIVRKRAHYYVSRLLLPLLEPEFSEQQIQDYYYSAIQWLYDYWVESDSLIGGDEWEELSRIAWKGKDMVLFIRITMPLANKLQSKYCYDTAYSLYKKLLCACQLTKNKKDEGSTLNCIGLIGLEQGDYAAAMKCFKQALNIQQDSGDKSGEAATLSNIALILQSDGCNEDALENFKQSLVIQRKIGDREGEGTTLNNIAQIFQNRGSYICALKLFRESLSIRKEVSDRKGESIVLYNMSQIYLACKDYESTRKYLRQSLDIRMEIGDCSGEAIVLNGLAVLSHALGKYESALEYIGKAIDLQKKIKDIPNLCVSLINMGRIHMQNKAMDKAISTWLSVYKMAKSMQYAQALDALSNLATGLDMPEGLEGWEALLKQQEDE